MNAILPQKSMVRRHIPIKRDDFRSLLVHSGFQGVPSTQAFRQNDELAAQWYWETFNFQRMSFLNFAQFRSQIRSFDFVLNTDSYAFSAHFTKPQMEPRPELLPQDIEPFIGDHIHFVDSGRNMTFASLLDIVHGVPNDNAPKPLLRLATQEYYHLTGFNATRQYRHLRKAQNVIQLGDASIQTDNSIKN